MSADETSAGPDEVGELVPLGPDHERAGFVSGEPALDEWLRDRALKGQSSGAARTYVVCEAGSDRVAGYYSLAASGTARAAAPGPVRRNMPDPVPAVLLGRLAVDRAFQGRGIGGGLLQDAVARTLGVAEIVGVRAVLVHALTDRAAAWYAAAGFLPSPLGERTLMLPLSLARRNAAG